MSAEAPTTYDNAGSSSRDGGCLNCGRIQWFSVQCVLHLVEQILSLLVLITAAIEGDFGKNGGGWVEFVAISAMIGLFVLFVLSWCNVLIRCPQFIPVALIIFIFYVVYTVFYLISGIVAAAWASNAGIVGACAFFCFLAMIVFGFDAYLHFKEWRAERDQSNTTTDQTNTTAAPATGTVA